MVDVLRVLMIEDSETDASRIVAQVRSGGIEVNTQRVANASTLRAALHESWDLIIYDDSMIALDAVSAVNTVRGALPEVPFVVLSDVAEAAQAVHVMRAGASDYVHKADLSRLSVIVDDVHVRRQVAASASDEPEHFHVTEDRLHVALEAAKVGVWDWDIVSNQITWSQQARRILRIVEQGPGTAYETFLGWVHEEDRKAVEAQMQRCLRGQQAEYLLEHRIVVQDGATRWVEGCGRVEFAPGGRPFRMAGTLTDTTSRRMLEEQLRKSQRMEAMGRVAGGVAHDFNNLLTVIMSYAHLAKEALPPDHEVLQYIMPVREAADRAAALTRQLLVFARRDVVSLAVLDLNQVVHDLEKLLRRLVPEDVELRTDLQEHLWKTRLDTGQCEQVIVNLAANARDAMPRGGILRIETSNHDGWPAGLVEGVEKNPGQWVLLRVMDNGEGMDEAVRGRAFEPFFSTKRDGGGAGLGLATCHAVVTQAGGHIRLLSQVHQGTTVEVYLPRCEASADVVPAHSPAIDKLPGGSETILIAEDDDMVRAMATRALRKHGYHVLSASSGTHALGVASSHPGPIHVLVTDVVMPRMSGPQLAKYMTEIRRDLRVLYTSGYASDVMKDHGVADLSSRLLPKPYTPTQLVRKVRDIIDAK